MEPPLLAKKSIAHSSWLRGWNALLSVFSSTYSTTINMNRETIDLKFCSKWNLNWIVTDIKWKLYFYTDINNCKINPNSGYFNVVFFRFLSVQRTYSGWYLNNCTNVGLWSCFCCNQTKCFWAFYIVIEMVAFVNINNTFSS